MIFLAITPQGLKKALEAASDVNHHIWCGSDAISESDKFIERVSRFNYPLSEVDRNILEGALETIKEHHPGQTIWIESD